MRRVGLVALLVCMSATAAAQSNFRVLRTQGYWSAFEARAREDGTPICGLLNVIDTNRGAMLFIKYFPQTDAAVIQLARTGWRVPEGQPIAVSFVFDNGTRFAMSAYGTSDPSMIEHSVRLDDVREFMRLFINRSSLRIVFLTGTEGRWTVSLLGSAATAARFVGCMAEYAPSDGQPFDASPEPQPFNAHRGHRG